ncbi:MAG: hydroxymethylglutaryl-CoA lyase [Proteobacteria bacterium]|nr:MAG: hydroxymethylglutaryl-CoA lyase [Pseudomonadota bacterium]
MNIPSQVKIVEVGPRDGLQNEPYPISVADKVALINRLSASGLRMIEAGSFVSPKWVPQMANSADVYSAIDKQAGVAYPMLVPNLKGMEAALAAGVKEIAVFAAASEAFTQKNIHCTIAESLARYDDVMLLARDNGIKVRGYVSCVLGCPYEGEISPRIVSSVAGHLYENGCYEVSLGDTIGTGTALKAQLLIDHVRERVPVTALAAHFHDTYGQGLANLFAVLQKGIAVIDSSVAGLGGCPYAKGASGNVATEDVLYMLHGMGISTGVELDKVLAAGAFISKVLQRPLASRVGRALALD